jgi:hypothetical protein
MLQVSVGVVCRYIWAVAVFQDYIGHPFDILLARQLNQMLSNISEYNSKLIFESGSVLGSTYPLSILS